jgi:hypothetical protein
MKWIVLILATLTFVGVAGGQEPIAVSTVEELASIGSDAATMSASYVLTEDLRLVDWTPIQRYGIGRIEGFSGEQDVFQGDNANRLLQQLKGFSGTFDGGGHTLTLVGCLDSLKYTHLSVFSLISDSGVVKNLRVVGDIDLTSDRNEIAVAGVAQVNNGLITACAVDLNVRIRAVDAADVNAESKKVRGSVSVGGIAVINNRGTIAHCYSTGSFAVEGEKRTVHLGGIAVRNGFIVQKTTANFGVSVNSRGGASTSTGAGLHLSLHGDNIEHCWSSASMDIKVSGDANMNELCAGGIVAWNLADINNCVALNDRIGIRGRAAVKVAAPLTPSGRNLGLLLTSYVHSANKDNNFYRSDMERHEYSADGTEQKAAKASDKNAVAFADMQQRAWWLMPDALNEKERKKAFGFPFGTDDGAPWVWDDIRQRPALYWETAPQLPATLADFAERFDILHRDSIVWRITHPVAARAAKSLLMNDDSPEQIKDVLNRQPELQGKLKSGVQWSIENSKLQFTGQGEISSQGVKGSPWTPSQDLFAEIVVGEGITRLGNHSCRLCKTVTTVTLSSTVNDLGAFSLANTPKLATLRVLNPVPPNVGSTAFMLTPVSKATLIVPKGAKAAYENASGWKKFKTVIEE